MSRRARAAGLALGFAADALLGDPRRGHPVAAFGRVARAAERRWWADSRPRGAAYTAGLVAGAAGLGWAGERLVRGSAVGEAAVVAAATWSVLGGTSLAREGAARSGLLREGDLPGARRRLSHLCARDATGLEAGELARASVESLAENTSDAVVAPLLWGAVAGAPGLLGYRAVNTLDAMVGYRSPRHQHFGWASARLDDLVNLVPARLAALLATATAWFVGGRGDDAWRVWQRDASAHPSPNAGQVEAAFAGALGVRLGGVNRYGDSEEDRGVLDGGREVRVRDLRRAVTLSRAVSVSALAVAVVVAAGAGRRRG